MKPALAPEVEAQRTQGPPGGGCYGAFALTHPDTGRALYVIASDGRDWEAEGLPGTPWEHVSISARYGCPTWVEMCWVKGLFWEPGEWVVQFHPAEADYVNKHPNCLHLWAPFEPFPVPPRACV